jgi:UDP-N-acetylglucosamine:LPS N-acetylglucosamine transferase
LKPTAKLALIYIDAGGGHRASALALQQAIAASGRAWDVQLVNLFEVFDPDDRFKRLTGLKPADYYNKKLARGWTFGMAQELKLLQFTVSLFHERLTQSVVDFWRTCPGGPPDLVVSLVPNFNRAIYDSTLAGPRPGGRPMPLVTILTDLADCPPNFWIEPGQDQHLVCGSAKAVAQARAAGYAPDRILPSSGMIIHPRFYAPRPADRAAARRQLGLDPAAVTGLVLFGGHGSSKMLTIAQSLPDTQLILMCGRNHALAEKLRKLPCRSARYVVEFTPEVPHYMALADFFIGKPGPGSISEAVCMGLPVIIESTAWTMPQEVYNAEWVREQQAGLVIKTLKQLPAAVADVVAGLANYRASLARIDNQAVFEIPAMLEQVMAARVRPAPEPVADAVL